MTDTLRTLLDHAEAQRNRALASCHDARSRRDAARRQAADLAQYRDGYRQRWQAQFERGVGPDIVHCWRQFADRLELAITQQAQSLLGLDAALAQAEQHLSAQELRVASVRRLIERRVAEQQRLHERREQKASDERAARARLAAPHPLCALPSER